MSHFDNQTPYVPTYPPALGSQKLMEVVLYHEIMYRRNRYRNHKRLYL